METSGSCSWAGCVSDIDYEYRFCAPNISRSANQYLDVNTDGDIVRRECPAGTYLDDGVCKNCESNEYSSAGAIACSPKTTCPVDTEFSVVQTRDINLPNSSMTDKQKQEIKALAGAVTDTYNLKTDRRCAPLNKCSMTDGKFVTDLEDTVNNMKQQL